MLCFKLNANGSTCESVLSQVLGQSDAGIILHMKVVYNDQIHILGGYFTDVKDGLLVVDDKMVNPEKIMNHSMSNFTANKYLNKQVKFLEVKDKEAHKNGLKNGIKVKDVTETVSGVRITYIDNNGINVRTVDDDEFYSYNWNQIYPGSIEIIE